MINSSELTGIEFFRNLDEQQLGQIAKIATLKEYPEQSTLFRQGQTSALIYFVLGGRVAVEVQEPGEMEVEVLTVGPGELLGWSPLLGRHAMTGSARTLSACRMAVLDVDQVLALCESEPRFGVAFLRQIALVLADRLWGTRRNLARALSHRPLLRPYLENSE